MLPRAFVPAGTHFSFYNTALKRCAFPYRGVVCRQAKLHPRIGDSVAEVFSASKRAFCESAELGGRPSPCRRAAKEEVEAISPALLTSKS